jgi:hypothetical protein
MVDCFLRAGAAKVALDTVTRWRLLSSAGEKHGGALMTSTVQGGGAAPGETFIKGDGVALSPSFRETMRTCRRRPTQLYGSGA